MDLYNPKKREEDKSKRETGESGEPQNIVVLSKTKKTISRNATWIKASHIETNLNQVTLTFSFEPIQWINIKKEENMTGGK